MIEVTRVGTIRAPAAAVWRTVADFGSADTYFPSILECRLEGSGLGARRHLRTDIGGTTVSELIELDDERMAMAYRVVESSLPIEDYTARVVVRPLHDGRCEVDYTSRCRPGPDTDAAALAAFLSGQLDSAIEGLRRLHEA